MPCTVVIDEIAQESCPTRPGLKTRFWVALTAAISSIGAATDHAVSTITAAASNGFHPWNGSRRENDFKSTPNENGGFNTEVKFFLNRQEAAKAKILTSVNKVEDFIAIVEDQNGLRYIIGSKDHPAELMVEPTVIPRNGYNVTISWIEHADLPLIFTGTVPLA